MQRRIAIGVLAALLTAPAAARAAAITMLGASPTSGLVVYSGGATPLLGVGISLDLLVGTGTPVNDGAAGLCIGCTLDFITGNFIVGNATAWIFDGGGFFSLTGGVDLTGNGLLGDAGDIPAGTALMAGNFAGFQFTLADGPGLFSGLQLGFLGLTMDPGISGYYGLGPGEVPADGLFLMTFAGVGTAPGAFVSQEIGNVIITTVPEPTSLLLLGTGLAAAYRRRRRA